MNPARSPHTTGDLPSRTASVRTSSTTSGSVTTVRTSSTSSCTGAGLKKCIPTTRPGRSVRTDSSVIESDEVLDAKIVSGPQILSSAANTAALSSRRSGTASTTRSASARSARSVVTRTRSSSAARSDSSSLPRATARAVECSMCSRPWAAAASSTSTATTSMPARANTSTMPAPIVPRPITPTRANSRATSPVPSSTPRDLTGPGSGDPVTCVRRPHPSSGAVTHPSERLYRFRR